MRGSFLAKTIRDWNSLEQTQSCAQIMSTEKCKWQLMQRDSASSFSLSQHGLIFIGCEECDIILQSPGVEKRHAVLSYNAEKQDFFIKDLNSMTGTYINDIRIPEQSYFKLNLDDQIRFGYGTYFTLRKEAIEKSRTEEQLNMASTASVEQQDIQEADSLEDLKEESFHNQHPEKLRERQRKDEPTLLEKREELTLPLNKMGHKISPLSSQVIINYSVTTAQSPDRKSDDLSSKTNGSADSSDSSAGTMTLTASQQQNQQQPTAMSFTIPFDEQVSSKTFTRKKPRLKEERARSQEQELERGTRQLRPMQKSSSEEHSSETEHSCKVNGSEKKVVNAVQASRKEVPSDMNSQAPLSETTSYLIQRMLDGSGTKTQKWASKRSPESTPLPSRWSNKTTPDQEVPPHLSSPQAKWGTSRAPFDGEAASSQAKWISRKTPDPNSPPTPSKWASRKSPEQASPTPLPKWGARKTPNQESPPSPSKWAILSSSGAPESPVNPSAPSKDKDGDDKSEAGTYTVDTELEDPVVEEARNKINEVFGVPEKVQGNIYSRNVQPLKGKSSEIDVMSVSATELKQTKHPIPTPPAEKSAFDFIPFNHIMTSSTPNLYSNSYRMRKEVYQHEHAQTPPPKPPPRVNRTSLTRIDPPVENGTRVMGRSFSNNETGDSLSDGSPQSTKHAFYSVSPWRRKSWNISCSDLELDQGKLETSSVLSDLSTSTEPSSHSSHSNRSRSGDVGPQMRLNRAFALRRARLGFESDEPVRAAPPGIQAVRPLPRGASVSQSNLSRQDGGRFSLRLPRSTQVKMNNKPVKAKDMKSSVQPYQQQILDNKSYVREAKKPLRKEDPSVSSTCKDRTLPLAKGRSFKSLSMSSSDSEPRRPPLHHSKNNGPVQKSASFSGGLQAANKSKKPPGSLDPGKRQPPSAGVNAKKRLPAAAVTPVAGGSRAVANKKSSTPRPMVGATGKIRPVAIRKEAAIPTSDPEPMQPVPHVRTKKEVSALDSLVISAIQQLSVKLKGNACHLLERERQRYPETSDTRLMIEEILPQMMDKRPSDVASEGNLTRDLSSILKNLKRVEQTLDVFAELNKQNPPAAVVPQSSSAGGDQMRAKAAGKRGFFVVDV